MNQAVSFGLLLGGGVLLVSAFSRKSLADVVKGEGPFTASGTGVNLLSVAGVGATIANASASVTTSRSGSRVPTTPSGGYTQTSWAQAFLQAAGLPVTQQNVTNVVAWEQQEGGNWNNSATYNPINTTQQMSGSTVMAGGSAAGVQAYSSWEQGLQATVATLQNGDYQSIIAALQSSVPLAQFKQAVNNSPWGTVFG